MKLVSWRICNDLYTMVYWNKTCVTEKDKL